MNRWMMAAALWGIVLVCGPSHAGERDMPMTTADFEFESAGRRLSGILDQPTGGNARALVVFVHGYGPTDVRGWRMFHDLRSRFAELGIASLV